MQMKKVLLYSLVLISFVLIPALAYETIIIKFPQNEGWHSVFYQTIKNEAIIQYVPKNETKEKWTQTIVVHSYKGYEGDAKTLSNKLIAQLTRNNPTGKYKYTKIAPVDTIAMRNTDNYNNVKAQFELFRVTKAAEGLVSIQYIDRNKQRAKADLQKWYGIISGVKTYNSYWLDERVMNSSDAFKL